MYHICLDVQLINNKSIIPLKNIIRNNIYFKIYASK